MVVIEIFDQLIVMPFCPIENTSVDNNSVETSKATDLEKESNMSGACVYACQIGISWLLVPLLNPRLFYIAVSDLL